MRKQDNRKASDTEDGRAPTGKSVTGGGMPPPGLMALQRSVGNAAVVEMLRRAVVGSRSETVQPESSESPIPIPAFESSVPVQRAERPGPTRTGKARQDLPQGLGGGSSADGPNAVPLERAQAIVDAWQQASQVRTVGVKRTRSPGIVAVDEALQEWIAALRVSPGDVEVDSTRRAAVEDALARWSATKSSSKREEAAKALQSSLTAERVRIDSERRRIEEAGYNAVADLLRDLRGSARIADVRNAEHDPLGPDLFGLRQPADVPPFLRKGGTASGTPFDYSQLSADEMVHLLRLLDMRHTPDAAEMDPDNWNVAPGAYSYSSERPSRQWALDPSTEHLKSNTVEMPKLVHAAWFGGTLRPTGPSAGAWKRFREAARLLGKEATFVLYTDRPRAALEAVRNLDAPPAREPGWSDWYLTRWAQEGGIRLVNLFEMIGATGGSRLLPLIQTELVKQTPRGYAAASDNARVLMHRLGGLYSDPDNEIMRLDHLKQMGTGQKQDTFASGTYMGGITNSVLAATRDHPIAKLEEEVLLKNYGMTQRELFKYFGDRYERPIEKLRRNSVLFRTGTALDLATEKAGYAAKAVPQLPDTDVNINSDMSWIYSPESEGAPRQWSKRDTLEFTQKIVHSMVRSMQNRDGDLHLTEIKEAVATHDNPNLIWNTAFAFLSQRDDLRPMLQSVTYSEENDPEADGWELIRHQLPSPASGLLQSSDQGFSLVTLADGKWLGEGPLAARLFKDLTQQTR
jgi:hypothetical protein